MRFLLDTNTCIDLMRHEPNVVAHAQKCVPDECGVSTVTTYELMTGAMKCRRPSEEMKKVAELIHEVHELSFDRAAAEKSVMIGAELERQGNPIGPYDVKIAGQAIATGRALVTSNVAEFSRIDDLAVVNWR
jgi:tRNA(fMet)-specific endonuclease VapC